MEVAKPARSAQGIVLRNTIILVGAQVLGTPLSILMSAALGRYLGAGDFGQIYLVATFIQLGFLFVEWGQDALLPGEVARDRTQAGRLLGSALVWRAGAILVVYGILATLFVLLKYEFELQVVLALMTVQSLFGTMSSAIQNTVRGFERTDVGAIGQVGQQLLQAMLVIPTLVLGGRLRGALIAQAAGTFAVFVATVAALRSIGIGALSVSRETVKNLFLRGTPFLMFGIAMNLQSNLDAVFLSKLATDEVVGWHAVARRLVGALLVPASALIGALYPTLSRLHLEDKDAFVRISRSALGGTALMAVPLALCCALYREVGVQIFGRDSFGPAQQNLLVLSVFVFLLYFSMPLGSAILAAGKQKQWAATQVICVIVSVGLDPLLIPWFQTRYGNGGLGLCVAAVISEIGMVVIGILMTPRGVFDRKLVGIFIRSLAAGVAMVGAGLLLSRVTPFVAAPIALAVYFGTLWAIGGVDRSQLDVVRQAIARKVVRR